MGEDLVWSQAARVEDGVERREEEPAAGGVRRVGHADQVKDAGHRLAGVGDREVVGVDGEVAVAARSRRPFEDLHGAAAGQLPADDLLSLPARMARRNSGLPGARFVQQTAQAVLVSLVARELEHGIGEAQGPALERAGDFAEHDASRSGGRYSVEGVPYLPCCAEADQTLEWRELESPAGVAQQRWVAREEVR